MDKPWNNSGGEQIYKSPLSILKTSNKQIHANIQNIWPFAFYSYSYPTKSFIYIVNI